MFIQIGEKFGLEGEKLLEFVREQLKLEEEKEEKRRQLEEEKEEKRRQLEEEKEERRRILKEDRRQEEEEKEERRRREDEERETRRQERDLRKLELEAELLKQGEAIEAAKRDNNNNNLIFILRKIHVNYIKLHESKLSTLISYPK